MKDRYNFAMACIYSIALLMIVAVLVLVVYYLPKLVFTVIDWARPPTSTPWPTRNMRPTPTLWPPATEVWPEWADVKCCDGTYQDSSWACATHGGICEWVGDR